MYMPYAPHLAPVEQELSVRGRPDIVCERGDECGQVVARHSPYDRAHLVWRHRLHAAPHQARLVQPQRQQ